MKGFVTSYNGLFSRPSVDRIEIPIFQRDYAQGRNNDAVARIRANFLKDLHHAVTAGKHLSLDFVYGDVNDNGTLCPVDGQQRITTLYLLHWYLACRADRLEQEHGWKHFEYATRPSARRFCERLVESKPPLNRKLREWFEDQYWFLHTWQHDPTIQSMLTMIEAIHKQFIDTDCDAAWRRLVESEPPVISFHVLPIKEMELSEDLYIKMNSRGKPLTDFENFKARFEQLLEHSHPPQKVKDFAHKVDVAWVDLLWPFKGSDNTVDNEFLRYFEFVSDICEWSDGQHPVGGDIRNLAKRVYAKAEHVYGPENERAEAHLDFLVRSFDTWVRVDVPTVFSELLTRTPAPVDTDNTHKLVLFGRWNSENLFRECCRDRDRESRSLPLLLYAFLLNLLEATNEFPRRLRMLRNLIEASSNQIRAQNMPALIDDVRSLIVNGNLSKVSNFNGLQVGNEQRKFEFLSKNPTLEGALFRLEDHDLLRGSLAAFEPLDASVFERRARAFHELFDDANLLLDFTGALLAAGDYSRVKHGKSMLGSGSNMRQWREEIFTGYSRERLVSLATVRPALVHILDIVAEQKGDVQAALRSFTKAWLEDKEAEKAANGLDWRWYFVRYEEMRKGHSGIYAHETRSLGYSVCMLEKRMMHSYYRDPYLSAIRQESGVSDSNVQGEKWQEWGGGPWFTGHESKERWMELKASRTAMRCVQSGIQLRKPDGESCRKTFLRVCNAHGVDSDDLKLKIPQTTVDGHQLDTEDRVRLGGALLRDLVAKGL